RVDINSVLRVVESGAIKTTHEAGTTSAAGLHARGYQQTEEQYRAALDEYAAGRKAYERDAFGIPLDAPANERPVSGYLAQPAEDVGGGEGYGEARFILKREARSRTTFTYGDSYQNENTIPEPLNAPKADAYPFADGRGIDGMHVETWAKIADPLSKES